MRLLRSAAMPDELVGAVSEVWRYPIKSMLGERLANGADITAAGISGDRQLALVDVETGLIASAKRPARWGRMLELTATCGDGDGHPDRVTITFPDGETTTTTDGGVDDVLSAFLGRKVRVATTPPDNASFEEVWDPGKDDSPLYGAQVGSEGGQAVVAIPPSPAAPGGTFFDFSAMHVLTTSSLAALRSAHPEGQIDVRRFRPNLVLEVPDDRGFVENEWARARLHIGAGANGEHDDSGGLVLEGIMPTMRCVMTTLAQPGLARDPVVLQATNRANRLSVMGMGDYACLGVFCRVASPGAVRPGDPVRVQIQPRPS